MPRGRRRLHRVSAGIAADNLGDRGAAGDDAALLQRGGDIGDVLVQATLRDQGAGDDGDNDQSERQAKKFALNDEGDRPDDGKEKQDCDDAGATPPISLRPYRD